MDVSCEGLAFRRGSRTVLDVPALRFASGVATALVGPNGAGKSTLLRLIAGLERPATGTILVGDMRVSGASSAAPLVSYAFQRAVFVAGSVRQNLDLALKLRGLAASERADRIAEAAAACGISELLERNASRLSGGEAQRANLARSLSLRAPVTLLDEPLSGLDGPGRRQLLHDLPALLRQFATTTIVVTHDRDEALRLASHLVVMVAGRVRAEGPRHEVFGSPPDSDTAAFLGYSLLPCEGGLLAIAPRALRPGTGDHTFTMLIEEVLDFGVRREAWGSIEGVRVSVRLQPGSGDPGPELSVFAPASTVRRYAVGT